ncbi:MAG: YjjG family noncanonical pyrimidine nucleotidase [Acutalibacteraceae bacterium]
MTGYTSLFLDLDDTLLDFKAAEAFAIRQVLKSNFLPSDDNAVRTYSKINKSFWESFERGEIPKSAIFTGRFKRLLEVFGCQGDPAALSAEYGKRLSEGYFTVEGAFPILDYLRDKGYMLYATTNGLSTTQYRRINGSGLAPYFDRVFVSEDSGYQKPEKEYFDYVVSQIPETDRTKMLIVGDSQSSDILGGQNAGIDTCWYNPNGLEPKYPSKYEISALSQLKAIL